MNNPCEACGQPKEAYQKLYCLHCSPMIKAAKRRRQANLATATRGSPPRDLYWARRYNEIFAGEPKHISETTLYELMVFDDHWMEEVNEPR